ncbi:MAG: queuosine precursor transporter [Helicobacteraceae bacterium]
MQDVRLQILLCVFITMLLGMNLLGGKIIELFGVSVSVGIFMVPFTFLITDSVEEVYGKSAIKIFIYGGILSLLIIFVFALIFIELSPHERYSFNDEYRTIFGSSLRMMLASLAAFIISQIHDAIAFEWWRKKTHGRALWIRNNFSTTVSQFIDVMVFMMIAFYGLTPKFTFLFVLSMAVPYYLLRVAFAFLNTPLVYLTVAWLKNGRQI